MNKQRWAVTVVETFNCATIGTDRIFTPMIVSPLPGSTGSGYIGLKGDHNRLQEGACIVITHADEADGAASYCVVMEEAAV